MKPGLNSIGLIIVCSLLLFKETLAASQWNGPLDGPVAEPEKTIVYIAEDLKNAGILGVGEGVREATQVIGWKLIVLDLGSKASQQKQIFEKALRLEPDAVILGGGDAHQNNPHLQAFAKQRIPVVSWHSSPFPGPIEGTPVFSNITTDSLAVAQKAADFVIADSAGKAGVVIFTDSRFAIAMKKAELMADMIRACEDCSLLSIEDIALDKTAQKMPVLIPLLFEKFSDRWSHSLGINDLYFDHAVAALIFAGKSPKEAPTNVSAGDGSPSALMRIRNQGYQSATVAEPLLLHGWQLIDELNRHFAGESPSGYVNSPYIVTSKNIKHHIQVHKPFEPDNNYRQFYRNIWNGKPNKAPRNKNEPFTQ